MDGYVQPNLSTPLQPSSEYYNGFASQGHGDSQGTTTSNSQRNISNNMTLSNSHLVCKCPMHNQGWLHSSYN
eukprot:jgi/Chlat1/3191/Chrsp22S03460